MQEWYACGPLSDDVWLSSQLGVPSFNWNPSLASGSTVRIEIPEGFVTAKIQADAVSSPELLQAILRMGFRLITVEVSLHGVIRPSRIPSKPVAGIVIREANPLDEPVTSKLAAKAFELDRFHKDPLISAKTANQIKASWVKNYFRGLRGSNLFIAEDQRGAIGFLLVCMKDSEMIVDLIAVENRYRGRGIASQLLSLAVAKVSSQELGDLVRVGVGTQIDNYASLRAYQRFGLELREARYVLHSLDQYL